MTTSTLPLQSRAEDIHHISPGEIAIGVMIARASEYFDFFVYAIASVLVFPSVFFPFESQLNAMLLSFVIFSFAFIARPIGTFAFINIQRQYSRETKLVAALFLLGFCTAGIAFLPTYKNIGFAAIIFLGLLRTGQGIALGGTWDGLPTLLALNAPKNKRGWYGMLGQLGAPVGFAIAAGIFYYLLTDLSSADFLDWGWRYPFYVAFTINVVALFARLRMISTKEYAHYQEEFKLEPVNAIDVVKHEKYNLIIGALAALASYALFHIVTVFPLSWITLYSTRSASGVLAIEIVGAGFGFLGVLASGLLADRFGKRVTLGILAVLIAIFSEFAPYLMGGEAFKQNIFILVGFTLLGLSYGQSAGAVTANFPRKYRYTGAALTSDLAWLLGAAFAPLIVLGLSAELGLSYVSVYLLSGALGTLAALSVNRTLESKN
ncbi:Major Facilitator Superfamily protein [Polynucleobacter meluiroseus]|uniref:Major Facilitator Superfamily protein n=1 Tax=Polynucleobacter meluiroseus TaxID=1938814 RepID=A0A240DYR2_9BURK|nr:MFS transporter [Polynucleobacter meluiroseus]SNX28072.1 Major Facilitator Superfamily protein [Polynucleobacter meluiroseus]